MTELEDNLAKIQAKLSPPVEEKDSVDRAFDSIVAHATGEQVSETQAAPPAQKIKYEFEDPLELAQLMHENVRFHKWQSDISYKLGHSKPTQHNPFKLCLTACNGSGKDAFVIAPFVVWFMLTRIDGLVVVTSSSGVQLTAQTETYISRLCHQFNAWIGRNVFKVIKRHIVCTETGSECRLFATDEPGKAEGYHPLVPGAEMAIVANEAKTIEDGIFQALSRCTGYNF